MKPFLLVLVEMKSYVLLLALLQSLGCSGFPVYNLEMQLMADRALRASLEHVNSAYAGSYLYRVTQGHVKRVYPAGLSTADLLMTFGVKETECTRASSSDPQTCAFRLGLPSFSCSSRVRMTATSAQVLSMGCNNDHSSSSESSEEILAKWVENIPKKDRALAPSETPPVQHWNPFQSQTADIRPRGDTFSNFLV